MFYRDLPCSPCLTNLNAKESACRLPVCIESITVSEVSAAFDAFMKGRAKAEEFREGQA